MNLPQPSGNRFTRDEQETQSSGDACISEMIFGFSGETACDLWINSLLKRCESNLELNTMVCDDALSILKYNESSYEFMVSEETEDDPYRDKPVGFYIVVRKRGGVSRCWFRRCWTEFFGEDLRTAVHCMVESLRRNDACPLCGRIISCENEIYCKPCKRNFNEPGCKTCKCPFGLLEDGEHSACKRRRTE